MQIRPTRENNFIWLLSALVLLLFCASLFSQLGLQGAKLMIDISFVLVVVAAVWSLPTVRSKFFIAKRFTAVAIILIMILDTVVPSELLVSIQLFALRIFIAMTIHVAWQQVMFTGQITSNTIIGSICIYMLIGLWFGFAYLIVEYYFPGSISGLDSALWQENLAVLAYYSMVTMTTLGYGDITPAAPLTRFLAYMEATIGVFYTTVLVASLIGLRLSGYRPKNPE
jgi:hypothetical protein